MDLMTFRLEVTIDELFSSMITSLTSLTLLPRFLSKSTGLLLLESEHCSEDESDKLLFNLVSVFCLMIHAEWYLASLGLAFRL